MGKVVFRQSFLEITQIGETESWLTDMAAEGLHLTELSSWLTEFERGEPRDMRYRIDTMYKENYKLDTQIELYADSGWEYVCEFRGFRVFRSPEELDAPEIHTDPVEQAYALKSIKRKSAINVAMLVFAVALHMHMTLRLFMGNTPFLRFIEYRRITFFLAHTSYLFIYARSFIIIKAIRKFARSVHEGRPINHKAPWKRQRRFLRISSALLVTFFMVIIALTHLQVKSDVDRPFPLPNENNLVLRLADIEQDPRLKLREDFTGDPFLTNQFKYAWSLEAHLIITVEEHGIIEDLIPEGSGEPYMPRMNYSLYKPRFTWMIDGLFEDLGKYVEARNDRLGVYYPLEEVSVEGIDRLVTRDSGDIREVIARDDGVVVYVRYEGIQDVGVITDAVCAVLQPTSRRA